MNKLEQKLSTAGFQFEKEQEFLYYPKTVWVKKYSRLNENGSTSTVIIHREEIITSNNVSKKELKELRGGT